MELIRRMLGKGIADNFFTACFKYFCIFKNPLQQEYLQETFMPFFFFEIKVKTQERKIFMETLSPLTPV